MTLSSKQLQRDRAFERSRLILAELEAGQSGFTRHALMRLEAGERTYGDQWTMRTVDELLGELTCEGADIGGWGVLALELLHEDSGADESRIQRVAELVEATIACGAQAHALLIQARRVLATQPRPAPPGMAAMPDRCRTCKAQLRWARMVRSGRPHPLDLDPTERGTVRLLGDGRAEVVTGPELLRARADGVELFLSHFATCPDRAEWRRAGGGNGARR